jgi:P protein
MHMFVGCLFIYVICFVHFRFLYADPKNFEKSRDTEFEELKKEISIWTRTYQSVTPVTKEEKIVKTLIKEKAAQLEYLLAQKINENKIEFENDLKIKSQGMIENYKINNKPLLAKCSIIFMVALVLFFLHPFIHSIHLSIGWISILAALILLAASTNNHAVHANVSSEATPAADVELEDVNMPKETNEQTQEVASQVDHPNHSGTLHGIDLEGLVHKVEWTTLLFFAGLFIFMRCIEELGLLNFLGNLISDLIKTFHNKSDRLAFALLILIILSALISSIIDNIPFTTAMIPIILQLSDQADVCSFILL